MVKKVSRELVLKPRAKGQDCSHMKSQGMTIQRKEKEQEAGKSLFSLETVDVHGRVELEVQSREYRR